MAFRFIHTADIHLDSPLRSLALRDPELADLIGNATRRAFVAIVSLCIDERVDALLLAGDLYDGDQTSMKTARFLAEQMRKLDAAGVRVFIIRGNHDAESRITNELSFPETVHVFRGRAEPIPLLRDASQFPVWVHGLIFMKPHAPESLLGRYRQPVPGAVNIGLMHTSLDGSAGHDLYAPCKLADLHTHGFDYWALGHIHQRGEFSDASTVVMPGMPQGRDINESGAKTASLVTIHEDKSIEVEQRLTSVAQFERVGVDLTGLEDWKQVARAIGNSLAQARSGVDAEHLIARLRLTGLSPLAWRLRRDTDLLKTEAVQQAANIGNCWVEGVEIRCADQASTAATTDPLANPIEELRRLISSDIAASSGYRAQISAMAQELSGQLPPECRGLFGADETTFETRLNEIIGDGVEDVLARMHATPDRDGA